jgi:hypothetical protein
MLRGACPPKRLVSCQNCGGKNSPTWAHGFSTCGQLIVEEIPLGGVGRAGNSLRAGTNSCAPGERAGARRVYAGFMRVAHTCSRLSSVLAVLCTAFFFLRTVPLPPVRTCRARSQEPGRRGAAQHGRARSGIDSSAAGPLRARPRAGRRVAGVLARSWRECTARARQ